VNLKQTWEVNKCDLDKLERKMYIGHKHGKQIKVINYMSSMYYGRKILNVCGYGKMILF
jgi:hypothetical protein